MPGTYHSFVILNINDLLMIDRIFEAKNLYNHNLMAIKIKKTHINNFDSI